MSQAPQMKSIWYFVGLVLLVMGGLVFLAGIIDFAGSRANNTVLAHTYPGVWWGAIMVAVGAIFYMKNRNATHE